MLVLGRKLGERVFINDNIVVTVMSIAKGEIRLGFDAPDDVTIYREEVHDKIVAKDAERKEESSAEANPR